MGFDIWLQGEYNEQNRLVECFVCKEIYKKKHMIKVGSKNVMKCGKCKKGTDWVNQIVEKNGGWKKIKVEMEKLSDEEVDAFFQDS